MPLTTPWKSGPSRAALRDPEKDQGPGGPSKFALEGAPSKLRLGGDFDVRASSRCVIPKSRTFHQRSRESARSATNPLFHSPPQQEIPILVTNNLYRESRKAQARPMREGSPNKIYATRPLSCPRFAANSLFRNILSISPCSSVFCAGRVISSLAKLLETRILARPR